VQGFSTIEFLPPDRVGELSEASYLSRAHMKAVISNSWPYQNQSPRAVPRTSVVSKAMAAGNFCQITIPGIVCLLVSHTPSGAETRMQCFLSVAASVLIVDWIIVVT